MDRSLMTSDASLPSVLKIEKKSESSSSERAKDEHHQRKVYSEQCGLPGQKKGHPNCKAKDVECRRCRRRRHLAKVCRTELQCGRIDGKANQVQGESEEDDFTIFSLSTAFVYT